MICVEHLKSYFEIGNFMKKILFILLVSTTSFAFAKVPTSGIATYKKTINIHASIPESQAALKAFIPEFKHMQVQVTFKDNKLRFKSKAINDDKKAANVHIKIGGDTEELVLNSSTKESTQYGNLMDIDYFVIQKLNEIEDIVKVDEEQTINGYLCKKAIDKSNDTVIWYHENEQIIVPGKEISLGFGLVVKVEGSLMSYDLLNIKPEIIEDNFFETPKNHTEISNEQFEDLQEEFMEEMQETMGGQVMRTKVKH